MKAITSYMLIIEIVLKFITVMIAQPVKLLLTGAIAVMAFPFFAPRPSLIIYIINEWLTL